jgi:methionine-rich copper-binding protein CopC
LPFTAGSGQLNVTTPTSANVAPAGYYMLFLVSNSGVPSVASIVQLSGADATPPTVVASSPASGSTGSSPTSAPTAKFSKPVQTASIQFSLQDVTGTAVTTTTSYNTANNTATFTPASPLRFGTIYTATVNSARDIGGRNMAGPYSWSFTTASPVCPCTMWDSSSTPAYASVSDSASLELGVKFRPEGDGFVTGVRFYKGPGNTGTHVGSLWSSTGTLLARATFTGETGTGWQNVTFANPVPVSAGATYVASYFAPAGGYAYDSGYFTAGGRDTPPLDAPQASLVGGNGVYNYSSGTAFPTSRSGADASYWVDVTFVFSIPPSTTPPMVSATSPAAGATGVALSAVASATFNTAVQPSTMTFALVDGSGAAVAGTVSYDGPSTTAVFTPTAPFAYGTTYTASVTGAKDLSGRAMAGPATWSFTTLARPACPCTIWSSTTTPGTPASNDTSAVELGVKFRSDANGFVTGVRFYRAAANGGTHIGSLWTDTGSRLATATFTNESATGWQQVTFSPAVSVSAGRTYVVSYFAPQGHYAVDTQYFSSSGVDTNPLHALRAGVAGANGVFAYSPASSFPSSGSTSSSNYWVDPIFELAPDSWAPALTAQTPAPGATSVSTSTPVTVTFSKAVQPGSITFGLTNAGSAVTGSVSYNSLNYTATFAPATGLAMGTTYTATVSGATDLGGTTMAAPSSWSFATAAPACPCTIWPATVTPGTPATGDSGALELGVKFTSDINGTVTGVRFFKGSGNTGTHIGNLWTSSGQLLASATFTGETASGWQQVSFSTPVRISSGTVYVVSYFAPSGHYAYDGGYFGAAYDNEPLHALAGPASGGNGVYRYSGASAFPTASNSANANYWVDVVLGS